MNRREIFKLFSRKRTKQKSLPPDAPRVSPEQHEQPPVTDEVVNELLSSPEVQKAVENSAKQHNIDPSHIQLALVAALGVGVSYSRPAHADIISTIVDQVVAQFEPLIQSTLGGLFESITGFLDESGVKEGAAIASLGDSLNEMQKSIANKKLALDAMPAPGECEVENWANKTNTIQGDVKRQRENYSVSRSKQTTDNINFLKDVGTGLQYMFGKTTDFIDEQDVPSGVAASTPEQKRAAKAAVALSPARLKPKNNDTFTDKELAQSAKYVDTLFENNELEVYQTLGRAPTNQTERSVYMDAVRQAHVVEACKVPFMNELERYAPLNGGASKQRVQATFLEDTAYSEVWHTQIKEMASSVPLLKSMVAQQAFGNTLLQELHEQQVITQKLLSLQLLNRS